MSLTYALSEIVYIYDHMRGVPYTNKIWQNFNILYLFNAGIGWAVDSSAWLAITKKLYISLLNIFLRTNRLLSLRWNNNNWSIISLVPPLLNHVHQLYQGIGWCWHLYKEEIRSQDVFKVIWNFSTLCPGGQHISWKSWQVLDGAFTPAINSVRETI